MAQPTSGNVDQAAFVVWRACVTDRLSSLLSGLRTERLTKEEFGRIEGATEPEGKDEPRPRGQCSCNKRYNRANMQRLKAQNLVQDVGRQVSAYNSVVLVWFEGQLLEVRG